MLKLTLAQINPTIGDIVGNVTLMTQAARKARLDGAALVVFPELSLTAYYPADLLDDQVFQQAMADGLLALQAATREVPEVYWVVGAPTESTGTNKMFHNSLLVLKDGKVVLSYHKQLLPTYNIFDERRHFEPGPDTVKVLRIGGVQIGFMICEDGWNDEGRDYAVNPFQRLADAAPDLVISINASPSSIGKREQRHGVFTKACARHALPLVYVNQIGGHDQLVFDGASFVVNDKGAVVFEADRFSEDLRTLTFDPVSREFTDRHGDALPAVSTGGLSTMEFYRSQIVLGLKDYARRCGFRTAVVGSSGGIDSALTLALAVEAFGAKNVTAITMPSEYSSAGSVDDSVTLCNNLGIALLTHPIRALVDGYRKGFEATTGTALKGLALENLQARIRGTTLMEYSNSFGQLVLTTGNKSEVAVGYATLYGDTNGGLGLIGDLYKTEIFELCRHLNATAGREIIPVAIIDKPPSAELAPDQKDTDSLPPYEVLDPILKRIVEGSALDTQESAQVATVYADLARSKEGTALIAKIRGMVQRNEYKRRQAPPILRVRGRAFGFGRQLPIAAKYL